MVKVVVSDNKGLVQFGGQNGSAVENNLNIRGRMMQKMTHADADARNHTLTDRDWETFIITYYYLDHNYFLL